MDPETVVDICLIPLYSDVDGRCKFSPSDPHEMMCYFYSFTMCVQNLVLLTNQRLYHVLDFYEITRNG